MILDWQHPKIDKTYKKPVKVAAPKKQVPEDKSQNKVRHVWEDVETFSEFMGRHMEEHMKMVTAKNRLLDLVSGAYASIGDIINEPVPYKKKRKKRKKRK